MPRLAAPLVVIGLAVSALNLMNMALNTCTNPVQIHELNPV
jgi:hypothetical protein